MAINFFGEDTVTLDAERNLLVSGASGHLGRRVVELLLEAKAGRVIAGSRHPEGLADLKARGAQTRKVDFDDAEGLVHAFDGVDRVLIISTDALDKPGRRLEQHRRAIEAARQAGVKHLVYTSMVNPDPDAPLAGLAHDHRGTEEALAKSGLGYTVLRNDWYAENLFPRLTQAVSTGQLLGVADKGGVSYITREDCARAAAAALASHNSGKQTLDICGTKPISNAKLAVLASTASGKPVEYVSLPAEEYKQGLLAAGLPEPVAAMFLDFETAVAESRLGVHSDAVAWLTGKKPHDLADFLAARRDVLRGKA